MIFYEFKKQLLMMKLKKHTEKKLWNFILIEIKVTKMQKANSKKLMKPTTRFEMNQKEKTMICLEITHDLVDEILSDDHNHTVLDELT